MQRLAHDRTNIDDGVAADAFWRLIEHLQHRSDAQNVDLMRLAGFCRNCLSDWLAESAAKGSKPINRADARAAIYGMPYDDWKSRHQAPATPEQLAPIEESVGRNKR